MWRLVRDLHNRGPEDSVNSVPTDEWRGATDLYQCSCEIAISFFVKMIQQSEQTDQSIIDHNQSTKQ